MKIVLLLVILIIPASAFAGGRGHSYGYGCGNGYAGYHSYGGYRSYGGGYSYGGYYSGYNTGRFYVNPYHHSYQRHHYSDYRHSGSGSKFDYSAYPTGSYSPDRPDFQYHSITPNAIPQDVYTWTDSSGIVHFSDTPRR